MSAPTTIVIVPVVQAPPFDAGSQPPLKQAKPAYPDRPLKSREPPNLPRVEIPQQQRQALLDAGRRLIAERVRERESG
jgi:hypothetical protein